MFEFTESIQVNASLSRSWRYLVDVERWWPASNPEHDNIEILGEDRALSVGTQIRIHEKVAGIPGEAVGEVTDYVEEDHLTWEAVAKYRLWGVPMKVSEGVRWSLRPQDDGVELSATVWAKFPRGLRGKSFEWLFKGPLNGVAKDRQHARRELEFIKGELERK